MEKKFLLLFVVSYVSTTQLGEASPKHGCKLKRIVDSALHRNIITAIMDASHSNFVTTLITVQPKNDLESASFFGKTILFVLFLFVLPRSTKFLL